MSDSILTVAYLTAAILFILSLRGLSSQETAKNGNLFGTIGMFLALLVTGGAVVATGLKGVEGVETANSDFLGFGLLAGAIAVGAVIGAILSSRVAMTSMPQLVAVLHSFVGLAAVLVGIGSYVQVGAHHDPAHLVETWIGVLVGGITFTGSIIAFAKLDGKIGSKPLILPGRHALNGLMVLGAIGLAVPFIQAEGSTGLLFLLIMTGISFVLGAHLVMAIGGADMPVVVSLLNSYSGWAAAAAGFMLSNDLLIVTGALVGSSGAILSYIMCNAMNRSIWNVIFGGFGADEGAAPAKGANEPQGTVTKTTVEETAELLKDAKSIVIIPGYGMAVAQAQHPVYEMTEFLRKQGAEVRYAIHPVAGRLPGHMNVLLAEANVPYDIVLEMDEINGDLPETDVVMVIGANDIVNPGALDDASSPIYGMPVLEAWKSKVVIVLKRSMSAGYAGVGNPLFFKDNTQMLFGDAKDSINKVVSSLRS